MRAGGRGLLEFFPEEGVAEGAVEGDFFIVDGALMAAFDVFVEEDGVVEGFHEGGHFSSVAGVDAVISCGGHKEDRGILHGGFHILVWGILAEISPLFGFIGVAVFVDPACACREFAVAAHVEEGGLAEDSAPEVGAFSEHHAHEEAAVGAALNSEMLWGSDFAGDEILGDADEVVVGVLAIHLARRLMPVGTKLAAATDIGEDVNAPFFEPTDPNASAIPWLLRNLEAAVAVEKGRVCAIEFDVLFTDLEIGHVGSIPGDAFVLFDAQAACVKECGEAFQWIAPFRAGGAQ